MAKQQWDIRLFFAAGLTLTGFLVTITSFTQVYKAHFYLPYPEAQTISNEASSRQEATFIAVGDIMLSRNVARYAEKGGSHMWMWDNILSYLHSSDFVFGNLEGTTNGTSVYSYKEVLVFNALPELIRTLPLVGFRVINLANNHALDQGEKGLNVTQSLLREIGIESVGVGEDSEKAWEPKIIEQNGIKIAFMGASYGAINDGGSGTSKLVARTQETTQLIEAVKKAKELADIVVVAMHAGIEYSRKITPMQEEFARTAIDNGADIIIGTHPHWVQRIEEYNGKYIFYSLGNFVFDQEFSMETKSGLTLKITLKKTPEASVIKKIELLPIIIDNYGQPRLATNGEKSTILESIGEKNDILTPLGNN